jgi:hypothetical protein
MGNSTCPVPTGADDYSKKGSSWQPMLYVSLVCTLITTAISISLIVLHLRRYRSPKEQRQIIRIVFSVVLYSFVALFEVYSYAVAQYIDPLGDVYEAFGLWYGPFNSLANISANKTSALYLLFVQYAAPKGSYDEDMFSAVKAAEELETSFDWPRITWIFVFQYPPVEIFAVIIQEITEAVGTYCSASLNPKYYHLWYEIIASISIGTCVLAIFSFRNKMKDRLKVKRALAKLACFKIIVFIRFAQAWVFSFLLTEDIIKTSTSYSYNDIIWGIPGVATCAEMVLFSLGFWYAFSSTEYGSSAKPHSTPLPVWRAVLDVVNCWDLIKGIYRIFPLSKEVHVSGDWKKWREHQKESAVETGRKAQCAVRKSVQKIKHKKGEGSGKYDEFDASALPMYKPAAQTHRARTESEATEGSVEAFQMTGMPSQDVYRPPSSTPPDDASSHLMAGRARSQSQGYYWNGQRYDRSPSPGEGFAGAAPTEGRDMV